MQEGTCSIQTRMEEEDKIVAKEADSAKSDTTMGSSMSTTSTGKKPQSRKVEEDKVVAKEVVAKSEADSAKSNTTNGGPMSTTSTSKKPLTRKVEPRVEEGTIISDLSDITTPFSANIVANLATTRQSVGKPKVRKHSQVDNSLITPRILT